ncbi:MAG: histidine phosphatase family protein [Candidatus Omnitrophica bacterium]|nr:histidine phosphatase family protein [Candidatus Omnitrophota bacterium]
MITKLFLIRHGTTRWNKERRYCGHKDVPLSREGKYQAKQLYKRLSGMSFDRVYASDRKRAIQTAQIIFKSLCVKRIPDLREINFGVLEGLSHEEILKKYPDNYRIWLKDPFRDCIPKAESLRSFQRRVTSALNKIVKLNAGKNIAVISHGGAISIFIAGILKSKHFWRHIPKTASVTIVEYRKNIPEIKSFNTHRI